ncbi:hypothetical protein HPT25_17520 [Bacillus sp. BRMEA1]|uniref:hypothetical protein n=1 Tax=Neobacillus endophyticus TaxID=2738405 RepID=UPI00156655BF|nr:hypothetical protein [Neobacillus endophyticus]NRD79160.1 hypothetical protein [Neobacillus endophyticus]
MKPWIHILIHIIVVFVGISLNRYTETRQDRKMYIALMIGGFIWSQIQTEYLLLRINKNTEKTVRKID